MQILTHIILFNLFALLGKVNCEVLENGERRRVFLLKQPHSYKDSVDKCKAYGGDIFLPLTEEDYTLAGNLCKDYKHCRIGIKRIGNDEWKSIKNRIYKTEDLPFGKNEPNDLYGQEDCIGVFSDGSLNDVDCNWLYPDICEIRDTSSNGTKALFCEDFDINDHKTFKKNMNFSEALDSCKSRNEYILSYKDISCDGSLLKEIGNDTWIHIDDDDIGNIKTENIVQYENSDSKCSVEYVEENNIYNTSKDCSRTDIITICRPNNQKPIEGSNLTVADFSFIGLNYTEGERMCEKYDATLNPTDGLVNNFLEYAERCKKGTKFKGFCLFIIEELVNETKADELCSREGASLFQPVERAKNYLHIFKDLPEHGAWIGVTELGDDIHLDNDTILMKSDYHFTESNEKLFHSPDSKIEKQVNPPIRMMIGNDSFWKKSNSNSLGYVACERLQHPMKNFNPDCDWQSLPTVSEDKTKFIKIVGIPFENSTTLCENITENPKCVFIKHDWSENYIESNETCEKYGIGLFEPKTKEDILLSKLTCQQGDGQFCFLGMKRKGNAWMYSDGVNAVNEEIFDFGEGQPSGNYENEPYLAIHKRGKMYDSSIKVTYNAICKLKESDFEKIMDKCPGYTFDEKFPFTNAKAVCKVNGKDKDCVFVTRHKYNFTDANELCKSMNSVLFEPKEGSSEEFELAAYACKKEKSDICRVGIIRTDDTWVNSNGKRFEDKFLPMTYSKDIPQQNPNELSLVINPDNKLQSASSSSNYNVICKMKNDFEPSCTFGSEYYGNCIFVIKQKLNINGSMRACGNYDAKLIEPNNNSKFDMALLFYRMNSYSDEDFIYIGLRKNIDGDVIFTNGTKLTNRYDRFFHHDSEETEDKSKLCLAYYESTVHPVSCEKLYWSMCEFEVGAWIKKEKSIKTSEKCHTLSRGLDLFTLSQAECGSKSHNHVCLDKANNEFELECINNRCYNLSRNSMGYEDAVVKCKKNGGYLADNYFLEDYSKLQSIQKSSGYWFNYRFEKEYMNFEVIRSTMKKYGQTYNRIKSQSCLFAGNQTEDFISLTDCNETRKWTVCIDSSPRCSGNNKSLICVRITKKLSYLDAVKFCSSINAKLITHPKLATTHIEHFMERMLNSKKPFVAMGRDKNIKEAEEFCQKIGASLEELDHNNIISGDNFNYRCKSEIDNCFIKQNALIASYYPEKYLYLNDDTKDGCMKVKKDKISYENCDAKLGFACEKSKFCANKTEEKCYIENEKSGNYEEALEYCKMVDSIIAEPNENISISEMSTLCTLMGFTKCLTGIRKSEDGHWRNSKRQVYDKFIIESNTSSTQQSSERCTEVDEEINLKAISCANELKYFCQLEINTDAWFDNEVFKMPDTEYIPPATNLRNICLRFHPKKENPEGLWSYTQCDKEKLMFACTNDEQIGS